jgi:hypothetical protein
VEGVSSPVQQLSIAISLEAHEYIYSFKYRLNSLNTITTEIFFKLKLLGRELQ